MTSFSHRTVWVLVGFLFTLQLMASTPESCLLFSLTSQQTARLGIVNSTKNLLNLSITNVTGEVFFSKSISGNQNFFQLLDLTKMPGGEYAVKLTGLEKSFEKKFLITNATIQLIKDEKESIPSFRMLDDKTLTVSYINAKKNAIKILLESDNDVIFEERELVDIALSKRYSLKNLPPGEYTAKLYSGSNTYSFPIILK
jgi:hypothetical protein